MGVTQGFFSASWLLATLLGLSRSLPNRSTTWNVRPDTLKQRNNCVIDYVFLCLTLRKEHRLRVFENRVLRGIFGRKMEEVTGGWRRLHNEELHCLYTSRNIIRVMKSRRMRWVGRIARMREMRNA
jgi:hypothetical protein